MRRPWIGRSHTFDAMFGDGATATVVAAVLAPLKLSGGMFILGWLIQPDQLRRVRNFTGAG